MWRKTALFFTLMAGLVPIGQAQQASPLAVAPDDRGTVGIQVHFDV